MSFDKIEFVKPNDILQGGFNPNLPDEITVTDQLLYSIANNLAILNNNLINSGALQNLALIGDLMQEVLTDDRVADKKTSVFKTCDTATVPNKSVFVSDFVRRVTAELLTDLGIANVIQATNLNDMDLWVTKNTSAVVNQAQSTYSFNVPVPSVSVTSAPATVNVSSTAPVVNNNVPVPHVTNNVEVAPAVPEITVNATAPIVNNNIPVPEVNNEINVQSATPTIEVNSTAPVVNVSSSPATVNVSSTAPVVNNNVPVPSVTVQSATPTIEVNSTAPVVNNNVPVPSVTVQSATPTIEVNSTAPVVNVSSAPVNIDNLEVQPYNDSALIEKIEDVRELLEDALLTDVDTDVKQGLTDVLFSKDNVINVDYPNDVIMDSSRIQRKM
jgi:hypothetical protein